MGIMELRPIDRATEDIGVVSVVIAELEFSNNAYPFTSAEISIL
jgi:hypothetical protein